MTDEQLFLLSDNGVLGPVKPEVLDWLVEHGMVTMTRRGDDTYYEVTDEGRAFFKSMVEAKDD